MSQAKETWGNASTQSLVDMGKCTIPVYVNSDGDGLHLVQHNVGAYHIAAGDTKQSTHNTKQSTHNTKQSAHNTKQSTHNTKHTNSSPLNFVGC